MGKVKLLRLTEKYGPNKENLNPHSDDFRFLVREQRKIAAHKRFRTKITKRMRKITREINEIKYNNWCKAKSKLFGYWYYWFIEGKIGPEEENEPNLLRKPLP